MDKSVSNFLLVWFNEFCDFKAVADNIYFSNQKHLRCIITPTYKTVIHDLSVRYLWQVIVYRVPEYGRERRPSRDAALDPETGICKEVLLF